MPRPAEWTEQVKVGNTVMAEHYIHGADVIPLELRGDVNEAVSADAARTALDTLLAPVLTKEEGIKMGATDKLDEDTPNPGSRLAVERGCTCPVMDNAHGRGWRSAEADDVLFWITEGCPLHDASAPDTTEEGKEE